jgi:hypothetical protein
MQYDLSYLFGNTCLLMKAEALRKNNSGEDGGKYDYSSCTRYRLEFPKS